ncbi:3-oxoacyl-[acyl-carrier protein] reductase [Humitalea rosea]|uniref:3-oxoacyl-[acyl-carrier protein] reductase n=1 Tax=Humitalea rosea TaxID=990373 RepID=A0A2W7HY78_9PROT|nr:SDR family oxidoreductase [Humitalea rosea]PZW38889.1 3-oxoacyl-[acyl-carrier protein] reductase [Humitalea rosea]
MLRDYTTVITGAGSGIGAAVAWRFSRENARVVVSDIDEGAAIGVARAIDPSGVRAIGLRCDVTQEQDCARLVTEAERFFSAPIDVFLANAGVSFAGNFLEAAPATLRRVVEVNVTGSILSAQAALRSLVRSPRASLIFTSSISGITARAKRSVYNASKHALTGLVKALALEFGPVGVRVNAIAPGATDTPFLRAHLAKVTADVDQAVSDIVSGMPLGRLISPDEFADAAVFLVSPASRSITGHTLLLDGGATAGRM